MKCKDYHKLMSLFLDGRLDGERERALKEHLAVCERCAEKLAFLEAAERRAREIEPEEPPREYWSTFSGRVVDRIETAREERSVYSLKRRLAGLFTISPARLRIAAGVVSVAVVASVVILYISRRGGDIVPPRMVTQTERLAGAGEHRGDEQAAITPERAEPEREALDTRTMPVPAPGEGEKKEAPATPDLEERAVSEPGARDRQPVTEEETAVIEERAREKSEPAAALDAEKREREDATALDAESRAREAAAAEDAEKLEREDATTEGAEKREEEDAVPQDRMGSTMGKRSKALSPAYEKSLPERKIDKSAMTEKSDIGIARDREQFDLNGTFVPKVTEADTSIFEDELKMHIERWTAYIESNPGDSLSIDGFEQVAIAYYLLSRLTRDEAVIREGSSTVREYADRAADPALRDVLLEILRKMEALRTD